MHASVYNKATFLQLKNSLTLTKTKKYKYIRKSHTTMTTDWHYNKVQLLSPVTLLQS